MFNDAIKQFSIKYADAYVHEPAQSAARGVDEWYVVTETSQVDVTVTESTDAASNKPQSRVTQSERRIRVDVSVVQPATPPERDGK